VATQAGRHLKKAVLELGGSDPFIVLADADLDLALDLAETGRFGNAGQSCTSSKRMIIHANVWDEFLSRFVERAAAWNAGDPLDRSTKLGPMASEAGRREIHDLVTDAVSKGATVHVGGEIPDGPGAFYPATVLTGVTPDMQAYAEELFGPVAILFKVTSVDEAIAVANDSRFGLGSAVFTRDETLAAEIADGLEVGMVGLNTLIRSQPDLPFGGVKASGIGRELGRHGVDEFANKKMIRLH
jgi:succinate-semialdehyde dehydrogenase/glutarate-semialdehyde dehydrogenase